jgi:hypothetical protein
MLQLLLTMVAVAAVAVKASTAALGVEAEY